MAEESMIKKLDRLFMQLNRNLKQDLTERLSAGISLSQLFMLKQIVLGADTVSSISQKLQISLPAVSKVADQLVKQGLITRVPSKNDRRMVVLDLTEKGKDVLEKNLQVRQEVFLNTFKSVDPVELKTLIDILEKIVGPFSQ